MCKECDLKKWLVSVRKYNEQVQTKCERCGCSCWNGLKTMEAAKGHSSKDYHKVTDGKSTTQVRHSCRDQVPDYPPFHTESDMICQIENKRLLDMCGFYYKDLSRLGARELLGSCQVGDFLIRDSSDFRYLYSLSVKTHRGITSARVEYYHGKFFLDCEERLKKQMPKFDSVLQLVDFYIKLGRNDGDNQCVWLESSGRRDTPVKLTKPVIKKMPTLQHLCRLSINTATSIRNLEAVNLPTSLKRYVREYPFSR